MMKKELIVLIQKIPGSSLMRSPIMEWENSRVRKRKKGRFPQILSGSTIPIVRQWGENNFSKLLINRGIMIYQWANWSTCWQALFASLHPFSFHFWIMGDGAVGVSVYELLWNGGKFLNITSYHNFISSNILIVSLCYRGSQWWIRHHLWLVQWWLSKGWWLSLETRWDPHRHDTLWEWRGHQIHHQWRGRSSTSLPGHCECEQLRTSSRVVSWQSWRI